MFSPPKRFKMNNLWEIQKQLTEGTFGRLFEVRRVNPQKKKKGKPHHNPPSPQMVAVAKVFGGDVEKEDAAKEVGFMLRFAQDDNLQHAIEPMRTFRFDGLTHHYFVTPQLDVDLSKYLDDVIPRPLTVAERLQITMGILNGLEQLHAHSLVHLDLKPNNILIKHSPVTLDKNGTAGAMPVVSSVVITDFGTAVDVTSFDHEEFDGQGTTLCYTAPEAITMVGSLIGPPSDVFSFGCIYYELLTLQPLLCSDIHVEDHTRKFLIELLRLGPEPSLGPWDFHPVMRKTRRYFNAHGVVNTGIQLTPPHISPFDPDVHNGNVTEGDLKCIMGCIHPDPTRRTTVAELQKMFTTSVVVGTAMTHKLDSE
jgi:serine/threonine protein kinase